MVGAGSSLRLGKWTLAVAADPGQNGSAVGKPEEEEEMDRRGGGPSTH